MGQTLEHLRQPASARAARACQAFDLTNFTLFLTSLPQGKRCQLAQPLWSRAEAQSGAALGKATAQQQLSNSSAASQDPAPEPEVLPPEVATDLPPELIAAVLQRLPANEVALTARRTCNAAAQHFADAHRHRTASIGQPLPPHAATEPLPAKGQAEAAFRRLTFHRKLRVLSVAATSGCEAKWRWRGRCCSRACSRSCCKNQGGTCASCGGRCWVLWTRGRLQCGVVTSGRWRG